MTSGLKLGGIDAKIEIYDWTGGNPGLPALGNYLRNQREAQTIADMITRIARIRDALALGRSPGLAELAAATGYYDQAHMTAEFQTMIGPD